MGTTIRGAARQRIACASTRPPRIQHDLNVEGRGLDEERTGFAGKSQLTEDEVSLSRRDRQRCLPRELLETE